MDRLRISVAGAGGRVGQRLLALIEADAELVLAGALRRDARTLPACDVLVDFSSPDGLSHWLGEAAKLRVAFVSGTTGLSAGHHRELDEVAKLIPVLHATNTSLGVAVLNRLAADAARMLGDDYDIEIVETHHRHKKDAPSGTADTLAKRILEAAGRDESALQMGRHGMEPRARGSIGVHSLRMGDVVGEHTAHFAADGERIEITHKATNRDTFARGALRAARWIAGKPPGRYTMDDVLGLG